MDKFIDLIDYEDIFRRIFKMMDIFIFTAAYTALGIFIAWGMNLLNGPVDEDKEGKKPITKLSMNIAIDAAIISVIFYILRQFLQMIRMPWEGKFGYKIANTKEAFSAIGLITIFLRFYEINSVRIKLLEKKLKATESKV